MKTRRTLTTLVLFAAAMAAAEADAQLFSSRSTGSSIGRGSDAAMSGEGVGTVTGRERYIRGNRSERNFVGTDVLDTREFVGAQNLVTTPRRTSTAPLRVETAPDANRAAAGQTSSSRASRGGLYSPRLAIGFEHPERKPTEVSTNLSGQLATSLAERLLSVYARRRMDSIEVSMEGGTATLRGTVSSDHERTLAQLLAQFEPGISEVQNELVVSVPGPRTPSGGQATQAGAAGASPSDTAPAKTPAQP